MSTGNFPNGSLVMRVWRFDGGVDLLAKFQYWDHAVKFARAQSEQDSSCPTDTFFIALCDYECRAQAFGTKAKGA